MDRMDYIQAVTRTRVLETRLLSRAVIERMVDAKDMEEVFKILGETEYANVMRGVTRVEDYENILSSELKRVYELMYEMSKDKVVVDLLVLKYDYHNLKVMFKEKVLGTDLSDMYVPISTTDFQRLKTDYLTGNLKYLEPRIREALEEVERDYNENKDPQRIDILFDRYYFNHLYELAKETDIPLFIKYVKDSIDFTNIRTLIRVKKQKKDMKFLEEVLLPNGNIGIDELVLSLNEPIEVIISKYRSYDISPEVKKGLEIYQNVGRLSEFERLMDDYLMELNKPSKYVNFGPEPIFSYIIAKETEVKILRIIMVSKVNKLSPEDIRERLRDLYV
ncbi:MAG: V-type ATP synthase subunit C [Tissierellia bacterium]|nr:V-type ATP synthase subunit C [Tissierellia bacterium]